MLTLPSSRCLPAASSSSRAPDPLRTDYDHPARTPDALRTGYDNPARIPDSLSRKAMRRGTARPPSPPRIAYAGRGHPRTPVNPPPPAPTHAPLRVYCGRSRGGGRCAQGGHTERGAVQPEWRTARGCTASAVSSHARRGWRMRGRGGAGRGGAQPKGRPHANGGVYARGWCPPAFSQRREDVRAGQGATRARAARETEGAGTLSAPSRPVNRLRKINVK
ncbi:hypothetical protein BJY52DRAFT_1320346 [Lactarius psammicola]|nr:hypothetical protein BJY52DRAFT_1320346 [Lactarius psammicola]